ncbi:MAG: HAD family hydrolase [Alphaproteobacteria bacterium]|nr:HAD family hydrolase [Alphaproteobacteria bacterium]
MKLSSKKLKVVIFDWDGTLAQSDIPRVQAINRVLKEYEMPCWDEVKNLRDEMLSFLDNFPNIFGQKSHSAYTKFCRYYKQYVKNNFQGFNNADKVINFFRAKGIKIAIMTNKDRHLLEYELPMLYSADMFDKIVCGHEAPKDKPYGDQALYTLKDLIDFADISPETVWIIGDSQLDNLCASAVNALPIRVNNDKNLNDNTNCKNIIFFKDYYSLLESID